MKEKRNNDLDDLTYYSFTLELEDFGIFTLTAKDEKDIKQQLKQQGFKGWFKVIDINFL